MATDATAVASALDSTETFCTLVSASSEAAAEVSSSADGIQAALQSSSPLARGSLFSITASTANNTQADESTSCAEALATFDEQVDPVDVGDSPLAVLAEGGSELALSANYLAPIGGSVTQGGRRLLACGHSGSSKTATQPIRTSDLSEQCWTVDDLPINTIPLPDLVPPVRHIQAGNVLLAGLLIHQVSLITPLSSNCKHPSILCDPCTARPEP